MLGSAAVRLPHRISTLQLNLAQYKKCYLHCERHKTHHFPFKAGSLSAKPVHSTASHTIENVHRDHLSNSNRCRATFFRL